MAATDEAALTKLATSTRVVVTTVGPYAKYGRALAHAILTRPEAVPESVKRDLQPLIGKYLQ